MYKMLRRTVSDKSGVLKRMFDFGLASGLLLIFSPIIIVVATSVLVTMGRPVLFRQMRPGLHGKPIFVLKFRTMTNKLDSSGELLADELRLTILGNWLRRLSLDELPQLVNVIRGDMSLVGPRPLLMEYMPLYSEEQARRHDVRPGITGWAQINGRNTLTWENKFLLDLWYVDHQSIWLDCKILALTVQRVFARKGISHQGEVTMPRFHGTKKDDE